MKTLHDKSEKS